MEKETKKLRFRGHSRGFVAGVPTALGEYQTTRHGVLYVFPRSSSKIGDRVEYQGRTWVVTRNEFSPGAPEYPADLWFEMKSLESDMDSRVRRLVAMADAMGLAVTNRPK